MRLLARADSEQVHVVDDEEPDLSTGENSPLLPHTPTITTTTTFHASSSSIRSPHHSGDNFCPPLTRRQTPVFYSFPNSASGSQRTLPSYVPRSDSPPPASELPPPSRLRRFFSAITSFMTPPLCAALLSMVVACIPPLQHALEVHLTPVRGALKAAGACAIPVTLVVLGAYFHSPPVEEPRQEDSEDEADSGNVKRVSSFSSLKKIWRGVFRRDERRLDQANKESRPGETKTVIVAIAARMVLTPLLLIPLIALCKKWELEDMLEE